MKILIIDNDVDVAEVIEMYLEDEHEVTIVNNIPGSDFDYSIYQVAILDNLPEIKAANEIAKNYGCITISFSGGDVENGNEYYAVIEKVGFDKLINIINTIGRAA